MLAPDLTVAENIFIDRLAGGGALINWKKLRQDAKEQGVSIVYISHRLEEIFELSQHISMYCV